MAIVAPFGFECFITVLASKIFLVSILLAIGTSFIPLGCFTGPTGTGPSGLRFYEQLRLVLTLQLLLVVVADVVENLRGAGLGAIAECALKVGSVRQMLEVVLLQKRPIGRRLHLTAVQAHGLAPRLHNLDYYSARKQDFPRLHPPRHRNQLHPAWLLYRTYWDWTIWAPVL